MIMEAKRTRHDGGVSLPEDVVFDVLARLPAKTLCRLRCVCKGWCTLISDRAFIAEQRSRAGPHLVGVFFEGCLPPEVRVTDMAGNVVRVFHVLMQQVTRRIGIIVHGVRTRAIPLTIDPAAGCACTFGTGGVIHWNESSFGRAAQSGSFKVLSVNGTSPYQHCKVTTIVDDGGTTEPLRWRQRSSPPFVTSQSPKRKATVNGVIYFMPHLHTWDSGRIDIAAFDLESEEWKMINGPQFGIQEKIRRYVTLTELKECLGAVEFIGYDDYDPYDDHCYVILWLLVDPKKSVWVKECTIEMPKTWPRAKQLWALNDGTILFLVSELDRDAILVFYNPGTKAFTKFMDIAMGFGDMLVLYAGSLLT